MQSEQPPVGPEQAVHVGDHDAAAQHCSRPEPAPGPAPVELVLLRRTKPTATASPMLKLHTMEVLPKVQAARAHGLVTQRLCAGSSSGSTRQETALREAGHAAVQVLLGWAMARGARTRSKARRGRGAIDVMAMSKTVELRCFHLFLVKVVLFLDIFINGAT